MKINKSNLLLTILWFFLLGLTVANISYYYNNKAAEQRYKKAYNTLVEQHKWRLEELRRKQETYLHLAKAPEPPPSPEEQEIINYINSGYTYSSIDADFKADCSPYERPWRKITSSSTCGFVLKEAVGDLNLLILEFASPDFDLDDPENKKLVQSINSDEEKIVYERYGTREQTTFRYLKTYFEKEAEKFSAEFTLTIDITEPIKLDNFPPYHGKSRREQLAEIGKSRRFFLEELRKAEIDIRDYDAIAITVFSTGDENFVSFAISSLRANVTRIGSSASLNGAASLLAHETAHLFGAGDQYIEGGFGCQEGTYDEYIIDNHRSLMCSLGPLDLDNESSSLINKRAARGMGWIDYE